MLEFSRTTTSTRTRTTSQLRNFALAVAALASLGAVISGIALSKGDLWGRGDFGWHHRFVWPAFGLLVALAVWRLVVRDAMSRFGLCLYLILMLLASGWLLRRGTLV